jgi:hypothetical protein
LVGIALIGVSGAAGAWLTVRERRESIALNALAQSAT